MRVTSISRINGVFLRLLALHSILLLSFPVSPQDTWDGPNNTEAELQTQAVSADPQSDFDLNILKIKSAELLTAQDGAPPGSPQSAPALEQNEAAITHDDIHQNQSGKDAGAAAVPAHALLMPGHNTNTLPMIIATQAMKCCICCMQTRWWSLEASLNQPVLLRVLDK